MITRDFYNIIDKELDTLLVKYKEDKFLKKHKSAPNNQKSYALLIWFLEFYGKISNYSEFITDGDDDSSCDIVFDNTDNQGNRIFYIVQSKWNNIENAEKYSEKGEILKALSDYETILRGERTKTNEKLTLKLDELDKHLRNNGDVKFLFLSLGNYNFNAEENIKAFERHQDRTRFEIIDINRLKVDYIDRKYKKIDPQNPLENHHNPEESLVTLHIERTSPKTANFIKIEKPFEAYVCLLRPKSIFELFENYGFSLFYKNVRNPLMQSQFNVEMEKTALEDPAYFWYYNNGITAITYLLPPIRSQAETVNLVGLQVINGAQTVYSIYRAYKSASPTKRLQMDSEALITLRLLKSGGKKFDLNVTRYTNSQNPVDDRDFCANDDIQVALQLSSFKSKYWFEKRNGEFREIPFDINVIPNYIFANVYLAYQLQDPISVIKNGQMLNDKDMIFVSHQDDKDGLYEKVFNESTKFEDMLCAYYVFSVGFKMTNAPFHDSFKTNIYHVIALFKVVFTKFLKLKYGDNININLKIIKLFEEGNKEILLKTFYFLYAFIVKQSSVEKDGKKMIENFVKLFFNTITFEKIKEQLEEVALKVEDIETIIVDSDGIVSN
jgi:hypothetical protein